jgi:putative methionine-R-sulfoxide reductase with GAF domain
MKAAYAFDRQKYNYEEIPSGDGLIGQCFLEQKTIKLTDIPEGFFNITSGIGKALPKNVFIFPLIYEDKVIGVLELANFYILQDFEIEWLEKANEHISGIIFRSKSQEELVVFKKVCLLKI